jgi:hypothetical protein
MIPVAWAIEVSQRAAMAPGETSGIAGTDPGVGVFGLGVRNRGGMDCIDEPALGEVMAVT